MNRSERQAAASCIEQVRSWAAVGKSVRTERLAIERSAEEARAEFKERAFPARIHEKTVQLLPVLPSSDAERANRLWTSRVVPPLTPEQSSALSTAGRRCLERVDSAERLVRARRLLLGGERRRAAETDLTWVLAEHARGQAEGWEHLLHEMANATSPDRGAWSVAELTAEVGGEGSGWVHADTVKRAFAGVAVVRRANKDVERASREIERLGDVLRERDVRKALSEMPLSALKSATSGRVRLGVAERAGFASVQDVLDSPQGLAMLSGLGEQSRVQIHGAALTVQSLLRRETPVRIDVKVRDASTKSLLRNLHQWGATSQALRSAGDVIDASVSLMRVLSKRVNPEVETHFVVDSETTASHVSQQLEAVAGLGDLQDLQGAQQLDPWKDFLARPSDYLGWLTEFGFLTEDSATAHGQLSEELVERVRSQTLDTSLLANVSLRGYQDFGARFAVVQGKVVIGDEMGLGKTIEALAFLAHVHATGGTHSLVVCPAGVVSNWSREVSSRSVLSVSVLHGRDRRSAAATWRRRGGVAVTTFETLRSLEDVVGGDHLDAVVVDEAHYVKNPQARRTVLTRSLIDSTDRALLLTGTPIENRLEEFENLVSYLQPELLSGLETYTPLSFPRLIAPAYLRRNQEDVLTELPERIDVDEWLPMSRADSIAYRAAVMAGNFMEMRRAAFLTGDDSAKAERLDEIVAEARSNHRKVIIFSYFRDVLDVVIRRVGGVVIGPLTGSVAAARRQQMVDDFTSAGPGAVLVSQISAGGVGLNIQAGSVVILCEPQVKPSMETQAVARAHRMGQTETVQVHRLLSDEGVDRRLVEILAAKQRLFDEFARVSHTADVAPEAHDVSESELIREVITAERERLARHQTSSEEANDPMEETA